MDRSAKSTTTSRWGRTHLIRLSLALVCVAAIVAAVVSLTGGPRGISGRHIYGTGGTTYQLVVSPAERGDSHRLTEQQARQGLDHPLARSAYSVAPHLVAFGFGRVTAPALFGEVPAETYQDRPAWVGVYEVPSKAVEIKECGPNGPGGPPPVMTPPANYYFAIIIDPDTGRQALWTENASLITAWRCSSKHSW